MSNSAGIHEIAGKRCNFGKKHQAYTEPTLTTNTSIDSITPTQPLLVVPNSEVTGSIPVGRATHSIIKPNRFNIV